MELSMFSQRVGLNVALVVSCFVLLLPVLGHAGSNTQGHIVIIPLSVLNVDEATATISVMDEPLSSFNTFLKHCQSGLPEDFLNEDEDFSQDLKKFCELTEQLAQQYFSPPTHHLDPKGYVISVPLKNSVNGIESLLWRTESLDDAIAFVTLLQGRNLKAVKVYATIPWGPTPTTPCTECPIKELVFSAKGMKEQLQELQKKEEGNS